MHQIWLKFVQSFLRYGILPKSGRFYPHCPIFTPIRIQPFRTISTVKRSASHVFLQQVNVGVDEVLERLVVSNFD